MVFRYASVDEIVEAAAGVLKVCLDHSSDGSAFKLDSWAFPLGTFSTGAPTLPEIC